MSDKELEISNISYTNKDFGSMYPELLKLANKLTTKWDPAHSDESDPGVVLLKEAAFVADHNNFNIDKNILENFLPSATQDKSVRNITQMNGYTPRYYVSANGKIILVWKYDSTSEETNTSFTIPAFTLTISNSDETISYIQSEDITIYGDGVKSTGKFIEGTLQTLKVNNSSMITLENIDDNNRLYFPESRIAQNGIYVRYYNDIDNYGYWTRDNYLLTKPAGSRVYKVDYDSDSSLPYIEFPSDIANIIGDGLIVSYIATSGTSGNVSSRSLTKLLSPSDFVDTNGVTRSCSNFTVYNSLGITNGKDPETINEMYQSFKKIVGTFDTLVTCKDYSNKIYSLEDSNGNPYISNGYVTDRRTDYNKSLNVITLDDSGEYFKNISLNKSCLKLSGVVNSLPSSGEDGSIILLQTKDSEGTIIRQDYYLYYNRGWNKIDGGIINLNDFAYLTEAMTPYDLVLYCLASYSASNYNNAYPSNALEKSFKPIDETTTNSIKYDLSDSKCISHNYKDLNSNDIFCFKNFAPLNVVITPYNKVEKVETLEILDNIYQHISEEFNPRKLNFGDNLDVNNLKEVIINSDDRIKSVEISPITYETRIMLPSGDDTRTMEYEEKAYLVDLVTKNIMAGRLCLFNFNLDFNYSYGQYNGKVYNLKRSGVTKKLKTILPIKINKDPGSEVEEKREISKEYKITSKYSSEVGANIKYIFNAPNYNEDLLVNNTYTLQTKIVDGVVKKDIFTVSVLNKEGSWDTVSYSSDDSKKISIYNSFGSDIIQSTEEQQVRSLGFVKIIETTVISSTNSGVINVDNYVLQDNEAFQIIYPNYYSIDTYGVYVNYRYVNTDKEAVIIANTEHKLSSSEQLILVYTSNGVSQTVSLGNGDIINSSFNIAVTDQLTSSGSIISYEGNGGIIIEGKFMTMSSSQTISTRALMQTKLTSTNMNCFWITDKLNINGKSVLFDADQKVKTLGNNEYFMYSNSSLDEVMILGSGTKLERTGNNLPEWACDKVELSIQSLTENGIPTSFPWVIMDFNKNNFLITEMNVVTLGKGDSVSIVGWKEVEGSEGPDEIENTFIPCYANITYTSNGETITLPAVKDFYEVRSRLDLTMSKDSPQMLIKKQDGTGIQTIKIGDDVTITGQEAPEGYGLYIQSSDELACIGDDNIDLSAYTKLDFYRYDSKDEVFDEVILVETDSEGKQTVEPKFPFFYYYENDSGKTNNEYIIPVYISGNSIDIKAKMYYEEETSEGKSIVPVTIEDYNTDLRTGTDGYITLKGNSLYNLTPINVNKNVEIYLEFFWEGSSTSIEKLVVRPLTVNSGINTNLTNIDTNILLKVKNKIKNLIAGSDTPSLKPHYTYIPDNSMLINNQDFTDPNVMWEVNNVANEKTIAQIDLAKSKFSIDSSMRNY